MSVALVTAVASSQMGVDMYLEGIPYWFTYLDTQVEDATITSDTRTLWEENYDGYEMVWTFSGPAVAAGDQNIDAACIMGDETTVGGGYCCGIKYVGAFATQPELWGVWFTSTQYTDWTASVGFSTAVVDTANWRSDDTSFTVTFETRRWLPKEQRSKEYYVDEYRFDKGDIVSAFTYQYTSDALYVKGTAASVTLTGALSNFSSAALAVAAMTYTFMN